MRSFIIYFSKKIITIFKKDKQKDTWKVHSLIDKIVIYKNIFQGDVLAASFLYGHERRYGNSEEFSIWIYLNHNIYW